MPDTAPTQVSPRHQMPSTSSGQNVDAASANDMATVMDASLRGSTSARLTATAPVSTVAQRNSRTRPRRMSVETTPATLTNSPDEVDRNAANAPAATTAPRIWPAMPGSMASGSISTAVSVLPVTSSSGRNSRDSTPSTVGNR